MKQVMGKKIGMTQVFSEDGTVTPVTVIEVEPLTVVQRKTTEIDGYDLTNTRVAETDISGEKTWVDKDNKDRPRSIIVNLLANDEKIDSQLVTAEDDWHYTFMTLDKYDREGQLINYTISEEEVEGYQTEVDGYDLINTLIEDESETPGHDPSKDSNDDPDRIEKQSDDDKDGENLPKTATNTYNLILFGLAIVIIGVLLSFFLRRKTN